MAFLGDVEIFVPVFELRLKITLTLRKLNNNIYAHLDFFKMYLGEEKELESAYKRVKKTYGKKS